MWAFTWRFVVFACLSLLMPIMFLNFVVFPFWVWSLVVLVRHVWYRGAKPPAGAQPTI